MCSASRTLAALALLALALLALALPCVAAEPAALRVCADPNNLPFSNEKGQGFENELATMLGHDLGLPVRYTWFPQRRGFIKNTLRAELCDVVMGVPSRYELAAPTRPYYRSGYVFVTRADRSLDITSFDDPRLKQLRIGIHALGDDYANVPPARALAARGLFANIVGYSIYGDYSQPDPPRALIDAVASGDVDIAVAWGPFAGYFALHEPTALLISPVAVDRDASGMPMAFSISMGVRRNDAALKQRLDAFIASHAPEIHQVLERYGVPLLKTPEALAEVKP